MRLFQCQACQNIVYFENNTCERCHHRLAFLPEIGSISALEPSSGDTWLPVAQQQQHEPRRFCANAGHDVCNWLTPPDTDDLYCVACRHNGLIPDVSKAANLDNWQRMEFAKHRLIYALLRWNLPLRNRIQDPAHGLEFDFPAEPPAGTGEKVMTGHENGLITVALIEADDVEREKRRSRMHEPYRTLLGHLRHEVGHHYWDILVRDGGKMDACRSVFGDESHDYQAALKKHYRERAPIDWQQNFVSAYASTHPWEDFAETWAHYLHIVDTLEMASSFGMEVRPKLDTNGTYAARIDFDPYMSRDIQEIIAAWLPFVFAMNSVSRTMGQGDLYPFILAPAVVQKLDFMDKLIHGQL
jgi:hypothetical protein